MNLKICRRTHEIKLLTRIISVSQEKASSTSYNLTEPKTQLNLISQISQQNCTNGSCPSPNERSVMYNKLLNKCFFSAEKVFIGVYVHFLNKHTVFPSESVLGHEIFSFS